MIPYLGCHAAREMLQAFVDDELPMTEQVALESHLRWCDTCAAHVEDLRLIGDSIRDRSAGSVSSDDARRLAAIQSSVLSRIRAERDQALGVRLRGLFEDFHLLWAGLGASAAFTACIFLTMGVLHAASTERPDSLADVIHLLANPGSDRNPVRLDGSISAPRALDGALPLDQISEDEAVYALAAVVTQEGRVANYELLVSERDGARLREAAAKGDEVSAMLDAVSQSRFEPAQGASGAPVAVNMVWLLARTTVKGTPRALELEMLQWRRSRLAPAVTAPPGAEIDPGADTVPPGVGKPRAARSSASSTSV
jgi:hypothetical protein